MDRLVEYLNKVDDGSFTAKIIRIMQSSPYITEDSYLSYERRFIGNTDYLDRIHVKDMKLPIMWGIDQYDRLFVAIKKIYYDAEGHPLKHNRTIESVETYFQRYSNNDRCWSNGSCYIKNKGYISQDNYEIFENLLLEGKTKCDEYGAVLIKVSESTL